MYKLIALDMDGTLLREDKTISKANCEAIKEARKKGIKVVLATGRPLVGIQKYLEELDLVSENEYAIAFNGALVQSTTGEDLICKTTLDIDAYKELYELSKELNVNIHALTDNTVLTPKHSRYTQLEGDINGIEIEVIPVEDIDQNETIVKVMFVDDPELIESIQERIPENIKEKYTIVRSSPFFLEFLNKSVNKGVGVANLAKKLNIKPEEVICVGDAGNDVDMIKYAGFGVAMGNAFKEAKKVASYITRSNEEDGVAHVIDKFMINFDKEFKI